MLKIWGGIIIPSVRYYAFPSLNFHPPTRWAVMKFRWVCPIFWILIQEDKNFPPFSFFWMLIRPKHTFVIGCTSLLFPYDFHFSSWLPVTLALTPMQLFQMPGLSLPTSVPWLASEIYSFPVLGQGHFFKSLTQLSLSLCLGLLLNCVTNKTKTGSSFHNITYKTIEILSVYLPYRNLESDTARLVLWRWNHFRLCLHFLLPLA